MVLRETLALQTGKRGEGLYSERKGRTGKYSKLKEQSGKECGADGIYSDRCENNQPVYACRRARADVAWARN